MRIRNNLKRMVENLELFIVPFLIVMIVRLVGMTLRYNFINSHYFRKAKLSGNCIFVFWHQKFFPLLCLSRNSKLNIMVSQHRDGELIARALKFLGFTVTRGSTTRGGMKACLLMTRVIKKYDIGITPDGPKGPRYHFSGGPITVAKFSGRPILPVGIGAEFAKYFSSWDRFMLPLPASRVTIIFGKEYYINRNMENNTVRDYLKQELDKLNRMAEASFSRNGIYQSFPAKEFVVFR